MSRYGVLDCLFSSPPIYLQPFISSLSLHLYLVFSSSLSFDLLIPISASSSSHSLSLNINLSLSRTTTHSPPSYTLTSFFYISLHSSIFSILANTFPFSHSCHPHTLTPPLTPLFLSLFISRCNARTLLFSYSLTLTFLSLTHYLTHLLSLLLALFIFLTVASEQADTAYGVFCLFNMIIYFVYAIILTVHRRSVIAQVINPNIEMYNSNSAEIVNPEMGHRGGDYGGDDVELQMEGRISILELPLFYLSTSTSILSFYLNLSFATYLFLPASHFYSSIFLYFLLSFPSLVLVLTLSHVYLLLLQMQ